MSHQYGSPPLLEAICEFRFDVDSLDDLTHYGLIYQQLESDFPKRKTVRTIESLLAQEAGAIRHKVSHLDRARFEREDGSALVQVGADLLAVNHLRPYRGWDVFRPLILKSITAFEQVAKPKGIRRAVMQYINEIVVPESRFKVEDYFNFYAHLGSGLPQDHGSFQLRVTTRSRSGKDWLAIDLRTEDGAMDSDNTRLRLTIDMVRPDNQWGSENVQDWLQAAHAEIEQAFESCLTDRARSLFESRRTTRVL